jgi:hypothetical protein
MNKISFLLLIFLLLSCERKIDYANLQDEDINNENFDPSSMIINDNGDVEIYLNSTGNYPNGTYCAEVEYHNPNTGTRNSYTLNVEVENGELTVIHWPNGGWLDETHFLPEDISTGEISFFSDKGYEYIVTIGDYGGNCYSDAQQLQNDVNNETEKIICPNCGDEKDEYDELCYSCIQKKEREQEEKTCPKCGGGKSSSDGYCDDCQDELDNEQE